LMTAPSEEGAGGGIFIVHLLFSFIFRPCSFPSVILRRRSFLRRGERETRPARASVSSCWIGNQAMRLTFE
jgi:hypothetical protein